MVVIDEILGLSHGIDQGPVTLTGWTTTTRKLGLRAVINYSVPMLRSHPSIRAFVALPTDHNSLFEFELSSYITIYICERQSFNSWLSAAYADLTPDVPIH